MQKGERNNDLSKMGPKMRPRKDTDKHSKDPVTSFQPGKKQKKC